MRAMALSLVLVVTVATAVRGDVRHNPSPEAEAAVRAAIVAAVQDRLGPAAEVTVDQVWMPPLTIATGITAVAEPGARVGRPMQFRLMAAAAPTGTGIARVGSAVASLTIRVEHARLLSPARPGSLLASGQVADMVDRVADVRLERLPRTAEIVGARVRQMLPAGVVLEAWMLERDPIVRSGDVVGVRAVVDGVEARGLARASERGVLGSVIRLVNVQSGRSFKGRVVGRGEVEVVP